MFFMIRLGLCCWIDSHRSEVSSHILSGVIDISINAEVDLDLGYVGSARFVHWKVTMFPFPNSEKVSLRLYRGIEF